MFTFNGGRPEDYGLTITSVDASASPAVNLALQSVPGRSGSVLMGRSLDPREFTFTARLASDSYDDASAAAAAVGAWLAAPELGVLVLDDLPDRYWLAASSGPIPVDAFVTRRGFEFTLVAPDPIATAFQDTEDQALTVNSAASTVNNPGNAPAAPVLTVQFSGGGHSVTLARDADTAVTLGTPKTQGNTATADAVRFSEDGADISDWSTGTAHVGTATGTMAPVADASGDYGFKATSFGSATGLGGPVRRRAFTACTDFQATMNLTFLNGVSAIVKKANESWSASTSPHVLTLTGIGTILSVKSTDGKVTYAAGADFVFTSTDGVNQIAATATSRIFGRAWALGVTYNVGDRVRYANVTYRCTTKHTSATSWGTNSSKFTNLGASPAVYVTYQADAGAVNTDQGMVRMDVLDASGNSLANFGVIDKTNSKADAQVFCVIGGTDIVASARDFVYRSNSGMQSHSYNDSRIQLTLERRTVGNGAQWKLSAQVWVDKLNARGGGWVQVPEASFRTLGASGTQVDVAAVDLSIMKYSTDTACDMAVSSVEVKYLATQATAVDVAQFASGDVLMADLTDGRVTLNGVERRDLFMLDSLAFQLPPGDSSVTLKSDASVSASLALTPRYW